MKKLNIDKVLYTASAEPVRNLSYHTVKPVKKTMVAPEEIIKGRFLYKDKELGQENWLECTWNIDGSERVKFSEVENHSLVEMKPKKVLKNVQLTMF